MPGSSLANLETRSVVEIGGPDARSFLQGLVSCDVTAAGPDHAVYGALLTPQGKFLHDLFVVGGGGDTLLVDCEAARAADLVRRLTLYRLRARATIEAADARWLPVAAFGPGAAEALGLPREAGTAAPLDGGVAYVDPRLPDAGVRVVVPAATAGQTLAARGFDPVPFADYDAFRIRLGLPDGSRDMAVDRTVLLEAGFDELHGVAWDKGCFVGQEVTSRTKHRGLVKRRLVPVEIDGPPPEPGTPITFEGAETGEMRSSAGGAGLALLRLPVPAEGTILAAGAARLRPRPPAWMAGLRP